MGKIMLIIRENFYFFILFFIWMVMGILAEILFTKEQLFFFFNLHYNHLGNLVIPWFTFIGTGWIFGIILLGLLVFKKYRLFFLGLLSLLVPFLVTALIKNWVDAPRPALYFHGKQRFHTVANIPIHQYLSFPSGHTTDAFSLFCFLSLVIPQKRWGIFFFIFSWMVAYSRMYLGQHFFLDVFAGSIIGTLFPLIIYWYFKKEESKTHLTNP
ncbi:MAG: phosphatase PAP2 family protein [Chitinophagaceae bacterium]